MPTYCYRCSKCGNTTDKFHQRIPHEVPRAVECRFCGAQATRDFSGPSMPEVDRFKEYRTDNMGHEPVTVTSRKHEARLCRERNLERIN